MGQHRVGLLDWHSINSEYIRILSWVLGCLGYSKTLINLIKITKHHQHPSRFWLFAPPWWHPHSTSWPGLHLDRKFYFKQILKLMYRKDMKGWSDYIMTKAKTDPSHDISSHLAFLVGAPPSSFCSTAKHQCAAVSRPIPSLQIPRPAPDMPGVWRATANKSTPGAKFLPLAWTFRISYRPWTSGGSTWEIWEIWAVKDPSPQSHVIPTEWPVDCHRLPTWIWRSKRPGRTNAWSRMSARFVAAITTSGESVHKECINWI